MDLDEELDGEEDEEMDEEGDEEIGDGVLEYIRLCMDSYTLPQSNDYFQKQRAWKQRIDATGFPSTWSWEFAVALSCISKHNWDIDEFINTWVYENVRELTIDGFIEEVEARSPKTIEVLGDNTMLMEDLYEIIGKFLSRCGD
jgi:hypothetical protein